MTSIKLNSFLVKHISDKAKEFFDLMKVLPASQNHATLHVLHELKNNGDTFPIAIERTQNSYLSCTENDSIGFIDADIYEFYQFISVLVKGNEIKKFVNHPFVELEVFEILASAKRSGSDINSFGEQLEEKINKAIKNYEVRFSLLYLEFRVAIAVGKVEFAYYLKEDFDKYIEWSKGAGADTDTYIQMQAYFQAKSFARFKVVAESERAIELAKEECILCLNVFKICSTTLINPFIPLVFDIDSNVRANYDYQVILKTDNIEDGLKAKFHSGAPANVVIDKESIKDFVNLGLSDFHNFLESLPLVRTELQTLIIQGINQLGDALSNQNYDQRIAGMFTILEALLLRSDKDAIIETVCKYCSKLVQNDPDKRKNTIALLKKMYGMRSKYVHHAIQSDFDFNDLSELQQIIQSLLKNLIKKSNNYSKKNDLLNDIDLEILKAYHNVW